MDGLELRTLLADIANPIDKSKEGLESREDYYRHHMRLLKQLSSDTRGSLSRDSCNTSLIRAIHDCGGVTSLLYIFARVIDCCKDAEVHADALDFILTVVDMHPEIQAAFHATDGYSMVNQALMASNKCLNSRKLLDSYMKHCIQLNPTPENDGFLKNPVGLLYLYRVWKKWHRDHDIAVYLYDTILALIQPNNPFFEENLVKFRSINLLQEITCMLHSSLFDNQEDNSFPGVSCLTGRGILILCKIIRILVGTPNPILDQVTLLVNALTLLHDSNKAYVCQSKQRMYFLLPQEMTNTSRVSDQVQDQNGVNHDKKKRHHYESISSIDDWLMIRTMNEVVGGETIHGIMFSQLINTLSHILCDLSIQNLPRILGPVLSVDHFIIWSNNENVLIREAVLKCLVCVLKKQQMHIQATTSSTGSLFSASSSPSSTGGSSTKGYNASFTNEFLERKGFLLIANQMSQYRVSPDLFSTLNGFILDTLSVTSPDSLQGSSSFSESLETERRDSLRINQLLVPDEDWTFFSRNWSKITPCQASAFTLLLSLTVESMDSIPVCHWVLQTLCKLVKSIPASSHILKFLFDNGIVQSLLNVLFQFHSIRDNSSTNINGASGPSLGLEEDVIENDIYSILQVLASKLINSSGNIFQEAFDRTLDLFVISYTSCSSQLKSQLKSETFSSSTLSPFRSDRKTCFREGLVYMLQSAFEDIERQSSSEAAKLLTSQSSYRG